MKDYCNLGTKSLDTRTGLASYLHGVICAMNRHYQSGVSQAIFEMYNVDVARMRWSQTMFFNFITDISLLVEDERHLSYKKILFEITSHMAVYKDNFKEN